MAKTSDADRPAVQPCAHCGLPTRWDDPTARSDQSSRVFCCHGCMGAYALIHEYGLEGFYALRDQAHSEIAPVKRVRKQDVLKDLEAAGVPVEKFADGLCRVQLSVDGLHCAACSWLIEKMQGTVPGLKSVRVRMSDATLDMVYDPQMTHPAKVAERLSRLGYALSPIDSQDDDGSLDRSLQREHWIGMATAFFLAANAMWIGISLYAGEASGMDPSHAMFLRWMGASLGLFSAIGPGRVFFSSAWASLRAGVPHVDIPVALGLGVGTAGSLIGAAQGQGHIYFDSLASLVFLLRVGRYIQFRAQYRAGLSLTRLLRSHHELAVRLEADGTKVTLPAYRLRVDDRVEVLPGQSLPVDGLVIEGHSSVQTAWITGESRPVPVSPGMEWVGGAQNLQSPLIIRVTAAGDQSRIGRLREMVRQATAHRTPMIQLADRVGGVFVLVVLTLAIGTFAAWSWFASPAIAAGHTIALLTIACPCALALAAPLVITVALGRAAREQIWIRDGNAIERLSKPGILWFDKTGTLTLGDLSVLSWNGPPDELERVAALESRSDHPAARAVVAFVSQRNTLWHPSRFRVEDVVQTYGKGIQGTVDGFHYEIGSVQDRESKPVRNMDADAPACQSIEVFCNGVFQGSFELGDRERPGAFDSLKSLAQRGWKIGILSGDRRGVVQSLAARLRDAGLDLASVKGEQSPEQKMEMILESKRLYGTTVMVGDGINDAAALSTADVGIAIRGASEVSLRHAPIFIPGNQLESIVRLVDAANSAVRGIRGCFAASLLYNAITISLAVSGWIHPLIAALFMPLSGITVLTMALLVGTFRPNPSAPKSRKPLACGASSAESDVGRWDSSDGSLSQAISAPREVPA